MLLRRSLCYRNEIHDDDDDDDDQRPFEPCLEVGTALVVCRMLCRRASAPGGTAYPPGVTADALRRDSCRHSVSYHGKSNRLLSRMVIANVSRECCHNKAYNQRHAFGKENKTTECLS